MLKSKTLTIEHIAFSIGDFHSSSLKIDKKPYKSIGIYYTGYIAIKKNDDYENIYSANPFYLIIGKVYDLLKEKMEINS